MARLAPALTLIALLLGGCVDLLTFGLDDDADANYEGSRCTDEGGRLHCAHHTTTLSTGLSGITPRKVHWQVPLGEPPDPGWPTVILFQGSLVSADYFWDIVDAETFGAQNSLRLTHTLLDEGFAVVTPEARLAGAGAWETNIPPMSEQWSSSGDHAFMLDIFAAIEDGSFGELDADRLYAAGISSGGYMTSRMDLAYRSRFRALAIHSASWATCAGSLCELPLPLDAGHLPTLFLHGEADAVVPIESMLPYHEALLDAGVASELIVDPDAGHGWLDAAPDEILRWFEHHV